MNSERNDATGSRRAVARPQTRGLRAWLLAAVALLSLAGLFVVLDSGSSGSNSSAAARPEPLEAGRAAPVAELEAPWLEDALESSAPSSEVFEPSESVARDEAPARGAQHDFEVEFQFLDSLDTPLGGRAVFAGPAGRDVNHVGVTDVDGRLRLRFQAFRESVALDFNLRGSTSMRERLELRSGVTTVVRRFESSTAVMAQRLGGARAGNVTMRVSGAQSGGGLALGVGDFKALESWNGWTTFVESVQPGNLRAAVDAAVQRPRYPPTVADRPTISVFSTRSVDAKSASSPATLRGIVRDSRGYGLEGAIVTAIDRTKTSVFAFSGSLGEFVFDSVAEGDVLVIAWKLGEGRARAEVRFEPPSVPLELALSREHLHTGTLNDSKGHPLSSWRLHILESAPHRSVETLCVTDALGRFEFWSEATTPLRISVAPNRNAALPALLIDGWMPRNGLVLRTPHDSRDGHGEARIRAVRVPPREEPGDESASDRVSEPATHGWLWRLDTGRGIELTADFPLPERVQFDARDLQPGRYEFELRRAGCAPVRSGPFLVTPGRSFDGGALAFAAPSRLRIESRTTPKGGANYGVLLARRGEFEIATQRLRLTRGAELLVEAGEFRFASEDLVETFASFSVEADAHVRLRPDGAAERLGP
jgi:hypothetical protein